MSKSNEFVAKGKILKSEAGRIVFQPAGTTYLMHLTVIEDGAAPSQLRLNKPVRGIIRAQGRKLYTVPSGGNFIAPIVGPPKIIQGRVVHLDEREVVVHSGGIDVVVTLPTANDSVDMNSGAIGVGSLVNVVAFPGATFEQVNAPAPALV